MAAVVVAGNGIFTTHGMHPPRRLTWSEMFESFLANKYTAAKR